ncbi:MAG TPA: hypothetical protein VNW06_10550 [Cytophagaceae bacterium]|nr:hypothetical protein [Cytophagaceae bacterium]
MKKIFFSTAIITLFMVNSVSAQYDGYAALFGRQTFYGGTARYLSLGGAATSLGADLGAADVNPAGLGMYRKSEFSFSPNFGISGSNTSFLGQPQRDNKGSFSLSNLGIAICGMKDDLDKSDWRGGTFSITMNRTNNFNSRISFGGSDPGSSMADYFVQLANKGPNTTLADLQAQDPTDPNGTGIISLAGLAYQTWLITNTTSTGAPYTDYLSPNGETIAKTATYTTTGAQYKWNIAYGANYKDKLYIGGSVGVNTINFKEALNYTETTTDPSTVAFNTFTFDDYNKIKGTGLNLKLGYIYKASDLIKFGSTITTPTYYWMNQTYSSDLSAIYPASNQSGATPGTTYSQSTVPGYFKFNYTTPLKLAAGMSIFAGKKGFVSGDIEYVPYQLSSLSSKNNSDNAFLQPYNKIINNSYLNVVNFKIGGELRIDIFRLRAGLAYLPNPYKYNDKVNRNIEQISVGAGVKLNNTYFDFGLINTRYQSTYQPYSLDNFATPIAVSKNSFVNAVVTMGFYFE